MSRGSLVSLLGPLLLIGCGSISNTTTPNPSTAADSYLATVIVQAGRYSLEKGQITVDTTANNGDGNLQLTNVGDAINSNLVLQFCPPPAPSAGFAGCFDVASFMTDGNGNAT